MVVTDKVYKTEGFLEVLTGRCFMIDSKDPISQIHDMLKTEGIEIEGQEFWDYPINEIEHIISEKINVVLVDVSGFYLNDEWEQVFRWFEVTGYEDKFKSENQNLISEMKTYLSINHKEFSAFNKRADEHRDIALNGESYIIRPFRDWYDILKEFRVMRHDIVRIAKTRYAKGNGFLFAMRMSEYPETPYISIEFDNNGKLLSIRKKDCNPVTDADERDFAERFRQEVLLPYINKK